MAVWYNLAIIEPPQSRLFHSGLNWANVSILIKKSSHGGAVVVWYNLGIIEPPKSRLFNSGLNWVVAIWKLSESEK